MNRLLTVLALSLAVVTPALAAMRTVTLSVPGMTCPACPITVKKALGKVKGVRSTEVNYERKQATVTFEDTQTSVDALLQASANAGYPAAAK